MACESAGRPLTARESAIVNEVAAAVSANPAKAGDLLAIALSHHPNLAHRLVLESIKRCPSAASKVLAAARLSRSIGARLVFSALLAVVLDKVLGDDMEAQAAETAMVETEPNAQHAQVAAFLAGLNAALALMPSKAALAAQNQSPQLVEPSAESDEADDAAVAAAGQAGPVSGLTAVDLGSSSSGIQAPGPDLIAEPQIRAALRQAAAEAGIDPLALEEALAKGGVIDMASLVPLLQAAVAAPKVDDALAAMADSESVGHAGGADSDQIVQSEPIRTIRDAPNSDGLLIGGDGQDWLFGGAGNDILLGGDGDDRLIGGADRDRLLGEGGNDELIGGHGRDYAWGGDGDDRLEGGSHGDVLIGGTGNDRLFGEQGADYLRGDSGNDELLGGDGQDLLVGSEGDDTLDGGAGSDRLYGGDGDDLLLAGDGSDLLIGGAGRDTLSFQNVTSGVTVDLGAGTARIGASPQWVEEIEDLLGSEHDDELVGDAQDNLIIGDDGNDLVGGGGGDDSLFGGSGDDTVQGGDGDDWLSGQMGRDRLEGGAGDDRYYISSEDSSGDGAFDVIADSEGSNLLILDSYHRATKVWAELHENGDLDIILRDDDGEDSVVARVENYAAAPEAFAGVQIRGREIDAEALIQRLEIEPPAPETLDHPATGAQTTAATAEEALDGDILAGEIADVGAPGADGAAVDMLALGHGVPDQAGGSMELEDMPEAGVFLACDELGQPVLRILGQEPDSLVWGQVDDDGDLGLMVRDAAGQDSLVATVECYAENPDALAAIEINGRSIALPDLLNGADLIAGDGAGGSLLVAESGIELRVEDDNGETETILVEPDSQPPALPPAQETDDDGQADGL